MTSWFKGRARMIFAILGGFVFLILQAIFPDLPFTEEQTLVFFGLIAAYALGEGLSGRTIGDNLLTIVKSQKFQALVAGTIVIAIKGFFPNLGITDDQLLGFIGTLIAFILGAGVQKDLPPVDMSQ
jgi:hypothetical protein